MSEVKISDGDYVLMDGAAWLGVKNFAVRVRATDEGVAVDIYKSGDEMSGAIASTGAFDNEVEDE